MYINYGPTPGRGDYLVADETAFKELRAFLEARFGGEICCELKRTDRRTGQIFCHFTTRPGSQRLVSAT